MSNILFYLDVLFIDARSDAPDGECEYEYEGKDHIEGARDSWRMGMLTSRSVRTAVEGLNVHLEAQVATLVDFGDGLALSRRLSQCLASETSSSSGASASSSSSPRETQAAARWARRK